MESRDETRQRLLKEEIERVEKILLSETEVMNYLLSKNKKTAAESVRENILKIEKRLLKLKS